MLNNKELYDILGQTQSDFKLTDEDINDIVLDVTENFAPELPGTTLQIVTTSDWIQAGKTIYDTIYPYYTEIERDIMTTEGVGKDGAAVDRFDLYLMGEYEDMEDAFVGSNNLYELDKMELRDDLMIPQKLVEDFNYVRLIYVDTFIDDNTYTTMKWTTVHEAFHSIDQTDRNKTFEREQNAQKFTLNYLVDTASIMEVIVEYVNQKYNKLTNKILKEYDIVEDIETVLKQDKDLWQTTLQVMETLNNEVLNNFVKEELSKI